MGFLDVEILEPDASALPNEGTDLGDAATPRTLGEEVPQRGRHAD